MRVPISWLREYVDLPASITGRDLAAQLIRLGLEVESVDTIGAVSGPLVVGRIVSFETLTDLKKPIRVCEVDCGIEVGPTRTIVCGATNFQIDDLVVVALPGAVLPGGFEIASRKTYGHVSEGMICSARELESGDDGGGILVLGPTEAVVGESASELLGLGEEVLDIAVTPDRGYALSMRGVARETALAFSVPLRDSALDLVELPAPDSSSPPIRCSSRDPHACDVITLRTIVGVDPEVPTPLWMSQRLIAAGMRPVSLCVDVTNYVMLETGQPLHAFDIQLLEGDLVARRAEPGELLTTLDHVDRQLDSEDLLIADDRGPLALAGTMGGLRAEIGPGTTALALEAAHFNDVVVAGMSRRHKLSTEASRRFERGVDPIIAPYASARAAALIIKLAGGKTTGMTAQESPHEPVGVSMAADLPARVAGCEIPAAQVEELLTAVGCTLVEAGGGNDLVVRAPSWRPDLRDPADLVEEVLRLLGYENIPSRLPKAPPGRGLSTRQLLRRRASKTAAAAGLIEVLTYPFVGPADLDRCQIGVGDPRRQLVRLVNPLSEERPFMRTTLLPGLLDVARRNRSRGIDSISLFEIGAVFLDVTAAAATSAQSTRLPVDRRPTLEQLNELDAALPLQPVHLAAVLSGERDRSGWWGDGRRADWSDAVNAARLILRELGANLAVSQGYSSTFHPGRCAQLLVDGRVVGFAGELHPRVVTAWDLPARTVALEFDLDAASSDDAKAIHAAAFSTMPVAKEDVAVVVDRDVPAALVAESLAKGAGELLEDIRLFDVYEGPQIDVGKKSLAFALRFRATDRTLGIDEVSRARDAAVAHANGTYGATLRTR